MSLAHITFDPSKPNAENHTIGAHVLAGDGTQIDSQTIAASEWLQVAAAMHAGNGTALGSTGDSLNVNVTNSLGIDVDLDHSEDSVRLGDGTNLFTGTTVGSDVGLDVNVINDPSVANSDLVTSAQAGVDDTVGGVNLIATALTARKRLFIQNLGSAVVYIGKSGVTPATGYPMIKGAELQLAVGAAIDVYGICDSGKSAETRHIELS